MTSIELLQLLYDNGFFLKDGRGSPKALHKLKKYSHIQREIQKKTPFLPTDASFAQIIHAIKNNLTEYPRCPICNNNIKFDKSSSSYPITCSPKCGANVETRKAKIKQTNLERYGTVNPASNKHIQQKRLNTNLNKYGVHHVLQNTCIQQKRKQTLINKYGTDNTNLVPEIQEKRKHTNTTKYGTPFSSQRHWTEEVLKKVNDKDWLYEEHCVRQRPLLEIAFDLKISDKILGDYLHKYGIDTHHFSHSTGEKQILSFVQDLLPNTEIVENTRQTISPYELDIYIPEHNLAIEYCGLYWHSDKFKENYYHRNKLHACQKQNIRLITIFEDEWMDKQRLVKQKVESILGLDNRPVVYARKTHIINIPTKTKNQFLNDNHIQGTGPGSVTYGLMYENDLVAIMTFIKRSNNNYELNRYATSFRVIGGFSKLLKHFQNNHTWEQITSFADLRWSEGNLYEKTGWILDKILPPDYYWVKNGVRYHKFNFRHKHLPNKIVEYNPQLSENENCKNTGMVKIYNCGLKRYIMKTP